MTTDIAKCGSEHRDLRGRRILIGGGTGDVGVAIVAQLLSAGAEVIAIVRSAARAEALGEHPKLLLIEGFPDDEARAATLKDKLDVLGAVHGAIASLGPWYRGPKLTALPKAEWDKMVTASLTSHFMFARAALPAFAPGGQYIMLNGAGALSPIPQSGVVSVLAYAQMMLGQVLSHEHPEISVHTLMLRSMIETRARTAADPSWITAREVGDACVWLLTEQGRLTAGSTLTLSPKHRQAP